MQEYYYTFLIILCGFILIMLDILIIPGGVVGTAGGLLILITISYGYKLYGTQFAITVSISTLIFSIILTVVTFKYRLWSILQHKKTAKSEDGFSSFSRNLTDLVGKEGETVTALRPSGAIKIGGKRYDCISQGEMIRADEKVIVTGVSGGQLVVKC